MRMLLLLFYVKLNMHVAHIVVLVQIYFNFFTIVILVSVSRNWNPMHASLCILCKHHFHMKFDAQMYFMSKDLLVRVELGWINKDLQSRPTKCSV